MQCRRVCSSVGAGTASASPGVAVGAGAGASGGGGGGGGGRSARCNSTLVRWLPIAPTKCD